MLTASIVLYKEKSNILQKTVASFLKIPLEKKLYLIDNSPKDNLKKEFINKEIEYIFVGKNIGFGSGHNLILDKIKPESNFHLVLNPDVSFEPTVIPNLIQHLQKKVEVAMISPKVIFPNGEQQYTCRKYPSVLEMIARRIGGFKNYIHQRMYLDVNTLFYPDFIHGCFFLFKTQDFLKINGFDERYFLYMEDVDICKKIDSLGKKKLYYPKEEIVHVLKQGSSKDVKLFFRHLFSAIQYFLKWGF